MGRSRFISQQLRQQVAERAGFACEYCRLPQSLATSTFEIDHILARTHGGPTEIGNLCFACPVCNGAKHAQQRARDPESGRRVRLFNPRRDQWTRHFEWSDDIGDIIGKTAIGRATAVALDMNPPRIVRLRQVWASLGMFPHDD
ncbi:MAG: HNH endonuclease signature motif containing protein [Planctomycetota bacterium]|nr:HNH endonuclease signature motif containing protein [Planctomycetota bacterium]